MRWLMCASLLAALAGAPLAGCGDNVEPPPPPDPIVHGKLAPCLDRPTDLARPPTGALPCELLPPDFKVPK